MKKNCNFPSFNQNGTAQKDDEMKWNHKKRTKDCFLMFCEVVLNHERELLSQVSFCIFFIYFCFAEKFEFLKFSIFLPLFVAINRHSTHPKNQLTRIELQRDKATSRSRTQHSIRTRMEEQMEKWQTTQMVSVWIENESGREKNFLAPCTSALNSSDNAFVSP